MNPGARERARSPRSGQAGFTLLEIMAVVAVVGILATHATYSGLIQQKLARRTEVKLALDAVRDAQRVHFLEHGRYASSFDVLPFSVDGAVQPSPTTMQSQRYTYVLTQPQGEKSYQVTAIGQIDSDPFPDVHVLHVVHP